MSKRFTATEKWTDPWFCSLSERERFFWLYLLDNCDNAGIWKENWMLVEFYFPGHPKNLDCYGNRVIKIDDEKWHIPKFIEFQYGELSEDCRPHITVIKTLLKYGLWKNKEYPKGIHTLKDKDKDYSLSLKPFATELPEKPKSKEYKLPTVQQLRDKGLI